MASLRDILLLLSCLLTYAYAATVSHDGRAITIDGKRRILLSGSIHYPRSTAQMWPDLIKKGKEGGLDAIETYVFWNAHEPIRRQYDFSGNLDLIRFIKNIQSEGLYAVLRIGPYACAEWNYGGFPVWLHNLPGVQMRTNNSVFQYEMQTFTTLIVDMMKKEKLFASQGGPIILAQIENEYGNIMGPYGEAGKAYVNWCANMANSLDIGVPWIMCQQDNAPQPMLNTCNGFYCDNFTPNNPNTPKMWTENWTGWFKSWGSKDPYRTAEDLAFAVARFFQRGGSFQNYYMYHGGTNFDRTAGGPYITTTYDYNAPLDEYGNLNQPKYGHLKQLHDVLHSMETTLTQGDVSGVDFGNSVYATIYATKDASSCFLSNSNPSSDATINFRGTNYTIPAWSVSVLPDCKTETYNTAKVNTQTSVMVKKADKGNTTSTGNWNWLWRIENTESMVVEGKGDATFDKLIDQKNMADDQSDYLWYMTQINLDQNDTVLSDDMSLRITGSAHVLHVYVNGEHVGSHWVKDGNFKYVYETAAKFNPGVNIISLLSVTVGLANYGSFFDTVPAGITGSVQIVGRKGGATNVKDLSTETWSYKTGLSGFKNQFFSPDRSSSGWSKNNVPTNTMMTWYKTTFKTPRGKDAVVVDLQGLGKGTAWINGNSIGRYWPSFIASQDGCPAFCDYRGGYGSGKCQTNCGQPTQRWYHVPRSFLNPKGRNTLVLFEEIGGNPSLVNFKTVTMGNACANAHEGSVLELSCNGKRISAIKFASFGNPTGTCGSFNKGTCDASNDAVKILTKKCVGKQSCSVEISETVFGAANCGGAARRLAVEAACKL